MMSILRRYLSARFLASFAFMLAALAALALMLDLMEQADQVLRTSNGGPLALLKYSALRLPDIVAQMLPIASLLGMLLVLGQFMRHRELVAMWGSGASPTGLMLALTPMVLVLAAVNVANNDLAVPESQSALRELGWGEARKTGLSADKSLITWLLSGNDVVRAPAHAAKGDQLDGVSIFRRDDGGRLIERIDAERAVPQGQGWLLSGVTRHMIEPAATQKVASLFWDGRIEVAALPLVASDMRGLRSIDLIQLIGHDGYGQRPPDRFRTWLQARIASALVPALMIFLAVALAQRFRRIGGIGTLLLSSIGIAFAFFILDGVCLTMGETGFLPPWLAAWSAKLALACLIGSFVVYQEG